MSLVEEKLVVPDINEEEEGPAVRQFIEVDEKNVGLGMCCKDLPRE